MIAFRQLILPGDVGSDVLAVKHTLRRMGVDGNDAMTMNNKAGPAYVATLRNAQANAGLIANGKYRRDTHAIIAPHFTSADEELYGRATIRRPQPEVVSGDAATNARKLLEFQAQGKYRADNPGDCRDTACDQQRPEQRANNLRRPLTSRFRIQSEIRSRPGA
jgi:hypothetical protein